MHDLQKANAWKRISAALCDTILLCIAVIGFALLLSFLLGYDGHADRLQVEYDQYAQTYGVQFDLSSAEYAALDAQAQAQYDAALEALAGDADVNYLYGLLINFTLIIVTFSILLAYLLLEFVVPLLLGNGQTLGKKVFGIGVMRTDGVKLPPVLLFARTILGKYTVETMIPALIAVMIYFNLMGLGGTLIILGLWLVQIILLAATGKRTPIHDLLAQTVTVDIASQMIFDTPEARQRYIAEHANEDDADNQ